MKRLFTLLLISFAALSCEMTDENIDDQLDKRDWVVFAEGTELTANVPSKQTVLNYKFESTLDWEVKTEAEWLEIDPMSGRAGKDIKIQIKVLHNKDKEGRTGYADLTLSNDESYRITINQEGEGDENEDIVVDIPNNQIWYTSVDGVIIEPYSGVDNNYADALTTFGVNIVSNTYVDGKGVIEFDGDVTVIGQLAFYYCNSLTSVTIPDSVTTIGLGAFYFCDSLTSATIPDSVTSIGDNVFSCCISLTSVTIPNSVPSIGYGAFWGCETLTSITIPDSVTTISEEAFANCTSLTSVTIGDSITMIGDAVFGYCSSLQEFKGEFASEDGRCLIIDGVLNSFAPAGLTEYTIPDSVTTIGLGAFASCTSLTSVTIPDSVTTIVEYAFTNCSSLQEFKGKFASEDGRCLIVDGVLNSFALGCGATEYTIPNSVTTIEDYAFWGCETLTSITIPDSVTAIGESAFFDCDSLTSVNIPDSVTAIGESAFLGCNRLTSVTIGNNVTSIGEFAFDSCSRLTSVYCKAITPPALALNYYGDCEAFDNNASDRKIYVPMESVEAYKSASGWSDYADDIVGYEF